MADTDTDTLSLEQQLARLRDGPLPPERASIVRALIDDLIRQHRKFGTLPDSTPGIREERDRRG